MARKLTKIPWVRRLAIIAKVFKAARASRGPLGMTTLISILQAVRGLTMVPSSGLFFTIQRAAEAALAQPGSAIVECGVWRGGASFAMALAQRYAVGRIVCPVHMLDSFQGLPPVTQRDGPAAAAWQREQDANAPDAFLRTPEQAVRKAAVSFGFGSDEVQIHPGWFAETALPLARRLESEGGISLLRLDGDWYDSTMQCLEAFGPLLRDGAVVIVDDYFAWDGCARAVHDWLSRHDLPWRVRSIPSESGAWLRVEGVVPGRLRG